MVREWTYLAYANKIIYTYSLRDLAKEFLILLYKMDCINFNFISANMYFNIPEKKKMGLFINLVFHSNCIFVSGVNFINVDNI